MARPIAITWTGSDAFAISLPQNPGAGGSFVFNGTLGTPVPNSSNKIVNFGGVSRTIVLDSGFNNSGTNFTIKGTFLGQPQSQTIVGPNNDFVFTTELFDTVTSVTIDNNLAGPTSIGSGETGQTFWIPHNYHASVLGNSVSVEVSGTINYTYQVTLDDVQTVSTPSVFEPVVAMTNASTNQLGSVLYPLRYSIILINSSGQGGSLVANFIQQGIT